MMINLRPKRDGKGGERKRKSISDDSDIRSMER